MLVAELAPRPDVPALMRRLPAAPATSVVGPVELGPDGVEKRELGKRPALLDDRSAPLADPASLVVAASAAPPGAPPAPVAAASAAPPTAPAAHPSTARPPTGRTWVLAALAPSRYRVQFTAGADLHEKITRAQALLRHQVPDGDLAAVVDRAFTLLVRELERARFAATPAPRKSASQADPTPSSRRIPDPIRRAVWMRDGEQCTFRDHNGRRCPARERLEFHHLIPFAQSGDHSASNLTLRCSSHNAHQADLDFGSAFMAAHRGGPVPPPPPRGPGVRA